MKTLLTISIVVLAVWLFVGTTHAEPSPLVAISGRVPGAPNQHAVGIRLSGSTGSLKESVPMPQPPPDSADSVPSPRVTISGRVLGASDKHPVGIMLWDSTGFLTEAVQTLQETPDSVHPFHFDVPPGRWAISAFEDRNDNGKLDIGFFGPTEPSGFWRTFHAWRKPRFDDVASQVDSSITDVTIKLH